MNRYLILITLFVFSLTFSQESKNRFDNEAESGFGSAKTNVPTEDYKDPSIENGPGNPGEPVPIDNYIPFLLLSGVGIIIYTTHKKKKLQSEFNNH